MTKNKNKKVLFISSTGGHFNELLQLKPLFEKYDYHIITEKDDMTKAFKEKYKDKISYVLYGTRAHMLKYIFQFIINCFLSVILFIKIRPEYIVTTGTHTAGPICVLGKIFGKKIVFIETFANKHTKTATGRIIYKFADLFIVQWEEMLEIYPDAVLGGSIY